MHTFPAPTGPIIAHNWPGWIFKLIWFSVSRLASSSHDAQTSFSSTMFSIQIEIIHTIYMLLIALLSAELYTNLYIRLVFAMANELRRSSPSSDSLFSPFVKNSSIRFIDTKASAPNERANG